MGDHDQTVPIADSALLSAKAVETARLMIYKGAPWMCATLKARVDAGPLAVFEEAEIRPLTHAV